MPKATKSVSKKPRKNEDSGCRGSPFLKTGSFLSDTIYVGLDRDALERSFGEVQQVATFEAPDHVFFVEDHVPIYICRKPRFDLKEIWPKLKERAFLNY